jgi:hypothetical protein
VSGTPPWRLPGRTHRAVVLAKDFPCQPCPPLRVLDLRRRPFWFKGAPIVSAGLLALSATAFNLGDLPNHLVGLIGEGLALHIHCSSSGISSPSRDPPSASWAS